MRVFKCFWLCKFANLVNGQWGKQPMGERSARAQFGVLSSLAQANNAHAHAHTYKLAFYLHSGTKQSTLLRPEISNCCTSNCVASRSILMLSIWTNFG